MNIHPTILTDSLELAQTQLDLVKGKVKIVDIDVIDGLFAQNITITPLDTRELRFNGLQKDFHLMTDEPVDYLQEISSLQNVHAVIGQVEHMSSQLQFCDEVKKAGWEAGLSLDLYTPISAIEPSAFRKIGILQLMGVQTGAQGQAFSPTVLQKIHDAAHAFAAEDMAGEIRIDGGITPETVKLCYNAGANAFAVGSYLWEAKDIDKALQELQFSAV